MASMEEISRYAEEASRRTGVPSSVIAAQAALESRYGRSAPGNNYFGIKAGKSWSGAVQRLMTTEYIDGKKVRVREPFRKYASPLESFTDWAKLISTRPRYAAVMAAKTPDEAMKALAASGYATDPKYYSLLRSAYRRVTGAAPTPPAEVGFGARTIRPGYDGEDVKALQGMLRGMGADIEVDGDYGPNTRAAVEAFQRANGLKVDGVVGKDTKGMLSAAAYDSTTMEARDAAAAARQQSIPSFSQAEAARTAPQIQGLSGSVTPGGDVGASIDMRASPVAAPRLTGSVAPGPADMGASTRMGVAPVRSLASAADNRAPPGIGVAPSGSGDPRLDLVRQALRPVGPEGGISTPADPRGWGPVAANRMAGIGRADAPVPRMNPSRASLAGSGSPLEAGVTAPNIRRPDFDFAVGPATSPQRPTIGNPAGIDMAARTRLPDPVRQNIMETKAARDVLANAPITPRRVQTTSIPQDVRISRPSVGVSDMVRAAGASARPAVDPGAMSRSFDIMSNYAPQRAPSPTSLAINPNSPASVFDIAPKPVFSAPKRVLTAPAQSPATSNLFANYATTQPATLKPPAPAPAYTATSPIAAAPIPRPNPLAAPQAVPQAMAATAVPAMPAPVPPKFMNIPPLAKMAMGLAIPGIGMGIGALNKIMGAGFKQSTAAQNARVSAGVQSSDMVGGRYGGASYGRKQSDGSVTGTTRSGTGYTSRDGGNSISVGGRSYVKNKRGTYSQKIG